jgi:hypothetical protein
MTVGEVLGESWALYTRHAVRLILVAAAVFGFLSLIYALVDASGQTLLLPLSAAVTIFGVLVLQGVLVVIVDDLRAGRLELSMGHVWQRIEPRIWTLLAANVIASVAIVAGLILFIIPGVVLLTLWCLFIPAVVLEGRGVIECFRRSMYLVQGNFLKVLVVIVVTIIFATIIATVIQAILWPLPRYVDIYLTGVVANSVTMPLVAVSWTIMFFELRTAKEGLS